MTDRSFGVRVALHDRCLNCGCSTAFVGRGPAPLYRQLLCEGCECGRGYASCELREFLESFVEQFGRPDRPIVLRTGEVHRPAQPGGEAATAPKNPKRKTKGKTKMKLQDLFPSKYLRAADIQGKPRVVVIDHVTHEDFKDDGANVKKTVLHFRGNGTAPVVLNKTNWKMLVAITGEDDDENWAGTSIELRSEKVNAPGGKIVDSIRVHEAPPEDSEAPKPKKAKAAVVDFNDEIPV
jgi:hypothetical protein